MKGLTEYSRPFAGAWIETASTMASRSSTARRPFAGAWIETTLTRDCECRPWSPLRGGVDRNRSAASGMSAWIASPLRGGVDRNIYLWVNRAQKPGRPFAGAWIETGPASPEACGRLVDPSRGRGSKHIVSPGYNLNLSSPLRGGVDRNIGR